MAVIEVWDTGIGIDPLQHTQIFTEFVQLANLERNRAQGLGLGLAIVKKLADGINARVTLRSAPGRGSVFALSLPRSLDNLARDPANLVPSVLSSLAGLRVLVVDDEQDVREAMQQLLASWGCACWCAGNLHRALVSVKAAPPDDLLTDYRLRDGVTGRDVIRAVRAALHHRHWGHRAQTIARRLGYRHRAAAQAAPGSPTARSTVGE